MKNVDQHTEFLHQFLQLYGKITNADVFFFLKNGCCCFNMVIRLPALLLTLAIVSGKFLKRLARFLCFLVMLGVR